MVFWFRIRGLGFGVQGLGARFYAQSNPRFVRDSVLLVRAFTVRIELKAKGLWPMEWVGPNVNL